MKASLLIVTVEMLSIYHFALGQQNVAGKWQGTVKADGQQLRVIVEITEGSKIMNCRFGRFFPFS